MAETVLAGLAALNTLDLSKLHARIAAARAELEKELKAKGQNPNATATPADITAAAGQAGISVEEFLALLETAKRRGLI